jgi:hypothetical protein
MSKENPIKHPTAARDEIQAILDDKLDKYVAQSRNLRVKRQEQFGVIDQFRIVRDQAVILDKLAPHAKTLMLAAALDRLSQLPDFDPASDLEALLAIDYNPEGDDTNE